MLPIEESSSGNINALCDLSQELPNLEPWEILVWYLRMLNNCLAHQEFKDEDVLPEAGLLVTKFQAEDVDLLESCPIAPTTLRMADVICPIYRTFKRLVPSEISLLPERSRKRKRSNRHSKKRQVSGQETSSTSMSCIGPHGFPLAYLLASRKIYMDVFRAANQPC
jgi:hypothetical protein